MGHDHRVRPVSLPVRLGARGRRGRGRVRPAQGGDGRLPPRRHGRACGGAGASGPPHDGARCASTSRTSTTSTSPCSRRSSGSRTRPSRRGVRAPRGRGPPAAEAGTSVNGVEPRGCGWTAALDSRGWSAGSRYVRCTGRRGPSVRRPTIVSTASRPTCCLGGRSAVIGGLRALGDLVVVGDDREVVGNRPAMVARVLLQQHRLRVVVDEQGRRRGLATPLEQVGDERLAGDCRPARRASHRRRRGHSGRAPRRRGPSRGAAATTSGSRRT